MLSRRLLLSTVRFAAVGFLACASAACSTDSSRFTGSVNPNPFSNPFSGATGSLPQNNAQNQLSSDVVAPQPIQGSALAPLQGQALQPLNNQASVQSAARQATARVVPDLSAQSDMPHVISAPRAAANMAITQTSGTGASASRVVSAAKQSASGWSAEGGVPVTLGQGETLATLSNRYGVPVAGLLAANGLSNANQAKAGQEIIIPVRNASVKSVAAPLEKQAAQSVVKTQTASQTASQTLAQKKALEQATRERIKAEKLVDQLAAQEAVNEKKAQEAQARLDNARKVKTSRIETVAPQNTLQNTLKDKSGDAAKLKVAQEKALKEKLQKEAAVKETFKQEALKQEALKKEKIAQEKAAQLKLSQEKKASDQAAKMKLASEQAAKNKLAAEQAQQKAAQVAAQTKQAEKTQVSKAPEKVADPETTASIPVAAHDFRWPARGRVISGFSGKGGNEGITIALPEGTPVKAAEGGVVAYSGSELKGYGNLVLVRHDNGFVSAYANNGELLVKRGEKVKRGQTIAKSGQTGNVSSPQLHFELRKGSTPVDPMQHLSGL